MKSRRPAFTLLEVTIALGIFGILSVTVIAIFMTSGREERRGVLRQQGVASARFVLESIAKDIRLGNVDYTAYGTNTLVNATGTLLPQDRLLLRLQDGSPYWYRCIARTMLQNGIPVVTNGDIPCLALLNSPVPGLTLADQEIQTSPDGGQTWAKLSVEGISIKTFAVYIEPGLNPYGPATTLAQRTQPRVTVALTVVGSSTTESQVPTLIQTTIAPRRYAPPAN